MPIHYISKLGNITKKFNVNVIWDVPSRMNGRELVISAIGDEKDINKIAKAYKLIGTIEKISFTKNFLHGIDFLQCLTPKQKEILIKAMEEGYYEYPRKINTNTLSEHVALSKSTTVEHLRKAENRLISTLLSGYQ
jgi:predicted DNA binding protein